MEIKLQPFDTQLTTRGFFSVYEQFKMQGHTAEHAYELTEEYCLEHKISIKYGSFGSFKFAYHTFLKKRFKKVRITNT